MKQFSNLFTIDLRRLRVLRELKERGTVRATAVALNLTPSAISQQITALSREVGVPLLTPQGRGVRLTPQALLLLDHAAAVDAQLERARADLAVFDEGVVGHVAIGSFATAITGLVAPALLQVRHERPRLRLSVFEVEAPECFTRLDAGDLDIVITVDYQNGPQRSNSRYSRRDLLNDPLWIAVAEDHPAAERDAIHLRELADQPWIVGALCGPCQEVSLAACTAAGFSPDIRHHVNDWDAALAMVAAGCGVALIPRLALPLTIPRGIALRPLAGPQRPNRHIYAATRAGSEQSPHLAPVLAAISSMALQEEGTGSPALSGK
jgi:DNA-binding transcriptional LysR family regulator